MGEFDKIHSNFRTPQNPPTVPLQTSTQTETYYGRKVANLQKQATKLLERMGSLTQVLKPLVTDNASESRKLDEIVKRINATTPEEAVTAALDVSELVIDSFDGIIKPPESYPKEKKLVLSLFREIENFGEKVIRLEQSKESMAANQEKQQEIGQLLKDLIEKAEYSVSIVNEEGQLEPLIKHALTPPPSPKPQVPSYFESFQNFFSVAAEKTVQKPVQTKYERLKEISDIDFDKLSTVEVKGLVKEVLDLIATGMEQDVDGKPIKKAFRSTVQEELYLKNLSKFLSVFKQKSNKLNSLASLLVEKDPDVVAAEQNKKAKERLLDLASKVNTNLNTSLNKKIALETLLTTIYEKGSGRFYLFNPFIEKALLNSTSSAHENALSQQDKVARLKQIHDEETSLITPDDDELGMKMTCLIKEAEIMKKELEHCVTIDEVKEKELADLEKKGEAVRYEFHQRMYDTIDIVEEGLKAMKDLKDPIPAEWVAKIQLQIKELSKGMKKRK